MLVELRVQNLAVIERSQARFGPGFNAITGETGAGKSVLLAGLGLALGARGDPELVRRGAGRALCSAAFEAPTPAAGELLARLGVEVDEGLVLSRELAEGGRSVARANGATVPASAIRALAAQLVDLQGQGTASIWLKEPEQRQALDAIAGARAVALRQRVSDLVLRRLELRGALDRLQQRRELLALELESARSDLSELEAAALRPEEDEQLLRERERLRHSGQLRQTALELRRAVSGGATSSGAADSLAEAVHSGRVARGLDPELDSLLEQAEAATVQLRELRLALSAYAEGLPDDSRRLEGIEERLELLRRLARRHGAGSLAGAI
ncbi:MAG: AAA family ATPase, partial [Candidatus Dormibacteria bacterium]